MDLAQFIVLTGAQAAGKSTIAKAIYYFSLIKELCFDFITGSKVKDAGESKSDILGEFLLHTFYELFSDTLSKSVSCSLEYVYTENTKIQLYTEENDSTGFNLAINFSDNIVELVKRYDERDLSFWTVDKNSQQLNRELENIFDVHYKPLYIPASRSVVTLMTDFLGELLLSSGSIRSRSAMQNLDYATQKYVREVLLLRKFFSEGTIKQIKLARMVNHLNASLLEKFLLMSMKIIKGEYFYREGAEFLRVKNLTVRSLMFG